MTHRIKVHNNNQLMLVDRDDASFRDFDFFLNLRMHGKKFSGDFEWSRFVSVFFYAHGDVDVHACANFASVAHLCLLLVFICSCFQA